ncbi:MAG: hypothetical protein IJQ99_09075 [Synergistaceae bacterium]|nr:hypothetical protein [Synergistaceae bacterium]MBQ6737177.1 hypothetical protein [Synergistaceae bacterium]MBR0234609.1 hypothetical protein [Synergistaceae bacterium]MBR0317003.1 hypothetical protein [Synergistaceae bacterium]
MEFFVTILFVFSQICLWLAYVWTLILLIFQYSWRFIKALWHFIVKIFRKSD